MCPREGSLSCRAAAVWAAICVRRPAALSWDWRTESRTDSVVLHGPHRVIVFQITVENHLLRGYAFQKCGLTKKWACLTCLDSQQCTAMGCMLYEEGHGLMAWANVCWQVDVLLFWLNRRLWGRSGSKSNAWSLLLCSLLMAELNVDEQSAAEQRKPEETEKMHLRETKHEGIQTETSHLYQCWSRRWGVGALWCESCLKALRSPDRPQGRSETSIQPRYLAIPVALSITFKS